MRLYYFCFFIVLLPTGLGAVVLAALCNSVSRSLFVGIAYYRILSASMKLLLLGGLHFPCDSYTLLARSLWTEERQYLVR